jgi:CTP synthase (UTP-ammonia lyase)
MAAKIAVVGEPVEGSKAQSALNSALDYLRADYAFDYEWVDTQAVETGDRDFLKRYDGIWSAPGGQFKSMPGTLSAIQYAREGNVPFLATCGGFQHTILEIARDVLGIADAAHQEYDPNGANLLIIKMACSLRGTVGDVYIKSDTLAHRIYGTGHVREDFLCSFGLNPSFRERFSHPMFRISATDNDGEIRILEISDHRYFVATLFVPQLRSGKETPHPLIEAFVKESCSGALRSGF